MADEHSTRIDAFDAQTTENLFENPSDNIFARIFTKVKEDGSSTEENCVPWKFCDIILSAIRDPRFNAKDVTFENCGEMLSRMASRRDEGWSKVAVRAHVTSSSGLPTVVLLGVLNMLKVEMQEALDIGRWGAIVQDFSLVTSRFASVGFRDWRETLRNIALVHPSWYIHARLLLGYAIRARHGPSPNLIRNPLFGGWTRELHISFGIGQIPGVDHSLLPFLCARVPNVRMASFSISVFNANIENLAEIICKGISALERVEEVVFLGDAVPGELILVLSRTLHPSLRTVRFLLPSKSFKLESEKMPKHMSSLSSLPNLRSIHVALYDGHRLLQSFSRFGIVSALSWHRIVESNDFALHHFCYEPRAVDAPKTLFRDVKLCSVRHAEFDLFLLDPGSGDKVDNVSAAISRSCSGNKSGCKITLRRSRGPGFGLGHFAHCLSKARTHPSVQELELITSLVPNIPDAKPGFMNGKEIKMMERVALDDHHLSKVLVPEITPGLRVVRVLLKETMLSSQYLKDFSTRTARSLGEEITSDTQFTYLLPECLQKCRERDIEFIVDILFEKESWH
ncbi:hypothetical protein SCHPADRAFT_932879, partial [Schizopora paradoxa]